MLLSPTLDPMGQAIWDYASTGHASTLRVLSSMFDDDEIPVATLFRTELQMPALERVALNLCSGHVLDVGAGAGCHSLVLQDRGIEVCSIDISPLSTRARTLRGVRDARCTDFWGQELDGMRFDTIVLLMNGLGIAGTLDVCPHCSTAARHCWLRADGCWPTRRTCAMCLRTKMETLIGTQLRGIMARWTIRCFTSNARVNLLTGFTWTLTHCSTRPSNVASWHARWLMASTTTTLPN